MYIGIDLASNLLDVGGVAELLNVRKSWVYTQVALKRIPFIKAGKYVRFSRESISAWLSSSAAND